MTSVEKRLLSLVLCLVLTLGAIVLPTTAAETAAAPAGKYYVTQASSGSYFTGSPASDAIGYRAVLNASFDRIEFQVVTAATVTLSIYKWNDTYQKTVAEDPLCSKTEDHALNQWINFDLPEALPAGEYLFLVTADQKISVMVENLSASNVESLPTLKDTVGFSYTNGVESTGADPRLYIVTTTDADTVFGTCTATTPATMQNVHDGGAAIVSLTANGTYGYRAKIMAAFEGFNIHLYSNAYATATCTIGVYEWKGEYTTTVAASPLFEVTDYQFTGGNYFPEFSFGTSYAAGEYLFLVSEPAGDVRIVADAVNEGGVATGLNYVNGAEADGNLQMGVKFSATSRPIPAYFGTCERSVPADASVKAGAHNIWQGSAPYAQTDPITEGSGSYAYRTTMNAPFSKIRIQMATGSTTATCTIGVYAWRGNYTDTVAAGPLYSQTYTDVTENAWKELSFAAALPAGEYLFRVYDCEGTVKLLTENVVSNPDVADTIGFYYVDGEARFGADPKIEVTLSGSCNRAFGILEDDIVYRLCQVSNDIKLETTTDFSIRFSATINSLAYQKVGFEVSAPDFDRQWVSDTNKVYSQLNGTSADGKELSTVSAPEIDGHYIVAVAINGVPAKTAIRFEIKPYVVLEDDTKVYGDAWTVYVTEEGEVSHVKA